MKDNLKYKSYTGVVHFNSADKTFFGKIIGINDLITFEGKTVEKLITAFHEAVEDYLSICLAQGKEPEKEYKGTFNIRVLPDLHKKAVRKATALGISLNQLVAQAIKKELHDIH